MHLPYENSVAFSVSEADSTALITTYVNSFFLVNDGVENIIYTIYGSPTGIGADSKNSIGDLYTDLEINKHWMLISTGTLTTNKSIDVTVYPYSYFKVVVRTSSGSSSGRIWTNTIIRNKFYV